MNLFRPLQSLGAAACAVLLLSPFIAAAADTDCAANGGKAHCVPVAIKSEWTYGLCDDAAPNMGRVRIWCNARQGSWNEATSTCSGAIEVTEGNGQSLATAFEQEYQAACKLDVYPTPWGAAYTSSNCPSATGPLEVNGVEYFSLRLLDFMGARMSQQGLCEVAWAEKVVHSKQRSVGCPAGYKPRTLPSGVVECVGTPPCEFCVGNPIDVGNGAKRLRETDYDPGVPGGLSFTRYYNSAGFFSINYRPLKNSDYWRHTFAARIYGYVDEVTGRLNNSNVIGAAVRPDGSVRYFNIGGGEVQNNAGGGYQLEVHTDSTGVVLSWTLATPDKDIETYTAGGALTGITTRAGATYALAYDEGGGLTTVTDSTGRVMTFVPGGSGNVLSMTTPGGATYAYGYDGKGRLASVTYPGGAIRRYLYEHNDHEFALTGIIDERGNRYATYGYDAGGYAISTEHALERNKFTVSRVDYSTLTTVTATDAFGTAHSYQFSKPGGVNRLDSYVHVGKGTESRTYDAQGNLASITNRRGYRTDYTFLAGRNLEMSRTEAAGTPRARTIGTTWHPVFPLPATITEPSGTAGVDLVTEFTYDASGNLTKRKLTAGAKTREWNYTYAPRGRVITIDGPRTDVSDVTAIAYYPDSDSCTGCRGQIHTLTNAAGQVTTFNAYNADGRPITITDPNGVATTLTYKPRGWLASRATAGEVTTYDYDEAGNVTKVTLPDLSWVGFSYDIAHGLVAVDDSLGNGIEFQLDAMGNQVLESVFDPQDQLKRTLQTLYDGTNRLNKRIGAAGQQTVFSFDGNDNALSTTDALGRYATNIWDELDRAKRIGDTGNYTTEIAYDAQDRPLTVTDPRSLTTAFTYDTIGNLLTRASPDTGTSTFTHDAAGNVLTHTDARGIATSYGYDALGRVTSAAVADGSVTYEYDNQATGGAYAKGRLTRVTDPSGNTTFAYDAAGRVTSKTQTVEANPGARTFTVGYSFSQGRSTGVVYPSGRSVSYGFNAQGQVTTVAVDSGAILSGGEYFPFGPVRRWVWANGEVMERTFDLDGQLKTLTLGPSTGTYSALAQVFGYDTVDRLITADLAAGQAMSYAYDANGNRTSATVNGTSTTYNYVAGSHRLASLTGGTSRSFSYDAAGNTTSTLGITFTYDGRGRMKQAGATTYLVNGLGQRVKKANAAGDIYFVYDEAGRLLGEYDTNGAPIQETVWLGDIPVAVIKPKQPSGYDVFYVWADHLNTPRIVSDATTNAIRWEWPLEEAFGANAPNENPSGLGAFAYNLRFPGQYFDAETGMHYNYFRDYDPAIGRYVQSDPIGLGGGVNTYGYVTSNPVGSKDPLGLWAWGGHNLAIDEAFPHFTPAQRDAMKSASFWMDIFNQAPDESFMHSMRAPGQDIADAKIKRCEYIKRNLAHYSRAKNLRDPWTQLQGYRALGRAMHAVADSTSPVHMGWREWKGGILDVFRPDSETHTHGPLLFSQERTSHMTPELKRLTVERMREVYHTMGCSCLP